ncbi:hypothetical protein RIF29_03530 [Crotalaria pallida]|uniref:CCHC-type domain-containing protein n=1 Tax=Crotalaria pallida TaxID=3830 RepID=A0AAN9J083_CROPI
MQENSSQLSVQEVDLVDRSKKKVKEKGEGFSGTSSIPVCYAAIYEGHDEVGLQGPRKTYVDSLRGQNPDQPTVQVRLEDTGMSSEASEDSEAEEEESDTEEGLLVVEKMVGEYDCPEFVLAEKEQRRIQKPWKKGIIVKLLGRKIGFRALETRLNQMWAKWGVINIIDLENDYFLVKFSNEDDLSNAVLEGPWLIYDHYLTVRQWTPDFNPFKESIERVAVWVRFSGLPIEYYDSKFLHFVGDRIGRTIRVDKTTFHQERGKYARLCVEVDLTKPLLGMFQIKEKFYKVEYEGLHLLCLSCGKFGHATEGCPSKPVAVGNPNVPPGNDKGVEEQAHANQVVPEAVKGPWVVVHKGRARVSKAQERVARAKNDSKVKRGVNGARKGGVAGGSRFGALQENDGDNSSDKPVVEQVSIVVPEDQGRRRKVGEKENYGKAKSGHFGANKVGSEGTTGVSAKDKQVVTNNDAASAEKQLVQMVEVTGGSGFRGWS